MCKDIFKCEYKGNQDKNLLENNFQSSETTKFMVNILGKHGAKIALCIRHTVQFKKKIRYICIVQICNSAAQLPLGPRCSNCANPSLYVSSGCNELDFPFPCICICSY